MESKKIRFAIDTHHLLLEEAGTKRVTLNILDQLLKKESLQIFECKPSYKIPKGKKISHKLIRHLFRFFWVHFQLPFICYRKKIDVLLSPEYNTPLFTTCKKAVIVHDVHMRSQRQFNSSLWFYFYYIPFIEQAIKKADLIITISNFSKEEIKKWLHIDEKKITVVYWGVDPLFLTPVPENAFENITDQYPVKKNKYLLFVGTFEARKNVERIIEAFSLLQKRITINISDI
ncbi:MAG: glycosyltransferase, partial [Bacteroidota bacterium]|nr:glycosyltransferase [Bacteroidota bacterium]